MHYYRFEPVLTQDLKSMLRVYAKHDIETSKGVIRRSTKGGLVWDEEALEDSGKCWVDKTSTVERGAHVTGSGLVINNSRVSGHALISGTVDSSVVKGADRSITDKVSAKQTEMHGSVYKTSMTGGCLSSLGSANYSNIDGVGFIGVHLPHGVFVQRGFSLVSLDDYMYIAGIKGFELPVFIYRVDRKNLLVTMGTSLTFTMPKFVSFMRNDLYKEDYKEFKRLNKYLSYRFRRR